MKSEKKNYDFDYDYEYYYEGEEKRREEKRREEKRRERSSTFSSTQALRKGDAFFVSGPGAAIKIFDYIVLCSAMLNIAW